MDLSRKCHTVTLVYPIAQLGQPWSTGLLQYAQFIFLVVNDQEKFPVIWHGMATYIWSIVKGASRYDVCIRGGMGHGKADVVREVE